MPEEECDVGNCWNWWLGQGDFVLSPLCVFEDVCD